MWFRWFILLSLLSFLYSSCIPSMAFWLFLWKNCSSPLISVTTQGSVVGNGYNPAFSWCTCRWNKAREESLIELMVIILIFHHLQITSLVCLSHLNSLEVIPIDSLSLPWGFGEYPKVTGQYTPPFPSLLSPAGLLHISYCTLLTPAAVTVAASFFSDWRSVTVPGGKKWEQTRPSPFTPLLTATLAAFPGRLKPSLLSLIPPPLRSPHITLLSLQTP